MKELIKLLVKEELANLLERRRAQPVIMYHGTSSKFLPKIYQLGMIPDPSEGKWKSDELEQQATVSSPSLRSLKGSYWTDNVTTAAGAARDAARTVGGKPMIVVAQIMPQSALADEDDVRGPVQRAFRQALIPLFGHRDLSGIAWPLQALREVEPQTYKKLAADFANKLHEDLRTSDRMPIDKKMLEDVFEAIHERLLGHIDASEGREKWNYIEAYDRFLSNGIDWQEARKIAQKKAEDNDIPKFDKVSGERKFLDALDIVSKRYKKSALPNEEEFRVRTNLRITEPVGFSGRNKIIAMLVGSDKNFELVYGSLPEKFVSDWTQSWGPKFRVVSRKSGEELHNSLNESQSGFNRHLEERLALSNYKKFCELVADRYDELPDYDPEAVASYKALIQHIEKMYKRMLSKVKVEFVSGQPYDSQKQMAEEVKQTGVLKISTDYNEHDVFTPEQNLKLRAVHDYIVHILAGVDFSDKGEVAAFNAHAKLLPPKAIPAAFTEIVGQACYANAKGHFPKQKIAIMSNFDFKDVGQAKGYDVRKKKLVRDDDLEGEDVENSA